MNKILLSSLVFGLVIFSSVVFAQVIELKRKGVCFFKMDLDQNGAISLEGYTDYKDTHNDRLATLFDNSVQDNDNIATKEEFRSFMILNRNHGIRRFHKRINDE